MKILLVGGGSGGPVSPLLAVAKEIKHSHPKAQFLLVGTKNGPEAGMAQNSGIPFAYIASGKLRRYFSVKNVFAPFFVIAGFFQAIKIIKKFKPNCIFATGSFVQVPVVWAGWFLGVPAVLHQQDVLPGLANKLCQFCAKKITVTFEQSLKYFSSNLGIFYKKSKEDKIILTGNPCNLKPEHPDKELAQNHFKLNSEYPTLLVLGGGTGAEFLNKLIHNALPQLSKAVQIIHSMGKGKKVLPKEQYENYHPYEFISDMNSAYAAADIVLARAGLSTLTELSYLKKLSIIVPMPDSHQELNAMLLFEQKAAIVLPQSGLSAEGLTKLVRRLLFEPLLQKNLTENIGKIMPRGAGQKIAEIILKISEKKIEPTK